MTRSASAWWAIARPKPESPREFLELSADVDFSARLVRVDRAMKFENEDYEARPGTWKLCFRAGREAVAAARVFAESWLAELER